jgi:cell division protein FtsA
VATKGNFIGAVEIGTSKVSVLIGEVLGRRQLNIVGLGQSSSRGIIKGDVTDFKAASDCTHAAIMRAEQLAGVKVDSVFLAQTGGHLAGFVQEAGVNVSSADNQVTRDDLEQVIALARGKELPADRLVIHHIRRPFRLDGRTVVNPEHLNGQRLDVAYWTVHGDKAKVSDPIRIINGFMLQVEEVVLASLASGAIVTTEEDRLNGVLVIDVGRGTTDWALYQEGRAFQTGTIPIGGDHITNDLSLGLRLSAAQAEAVKTKYGRATVQANRTEKVMLNGDFAIGDKLLSRLAIDQIITARVEEIFSVVKRSAGPTAALLRPENLRAGVVVTGGTSRLPQVDEAAARVLGLSTRVGEMPEWVRSDLRDPSFATVLGLLHYGLQCRQARRAAPGRVTNFIRQLSRYFSPS